MVEGWAGRGQPGKHGGSHFSGCRGGWGYPSRWGGWGWIPSRPGWGPPDAGQPMDGVGNLEEADEEGIDPDMPELPEDDDDEDEEGKGNQGGEEPPAVRISTRGNRGVPPTRYHNVFELAADIMSPPTVAMALDGEKGAKWASAMEAELDSLWEKEVYEEVPRLLLGPL